MEWHGLKPRHLAVILGVKEETVYKKLDGRRNFTTTDLIRLAARVRVDPGRLLDPPTSIEDLGHGLEQDDPVVALVGARGGAPVRGRAPGLVTSSKGQHRWSALRRSVRTLDRNAA